jgi:hypothetical protein
VNIDVFVTEREKTKQNMNNAHTNYILPRVNVHVKKMAEHINREKSFIKI